MFKKTKAFVLATCIVTSVGSWSIAYATPEESIQENKVKFDSLSNEILELNAKVSELNSELETLNATLEENKLEIKN